MVTLWASTFEASDSVDTSESASVHSQVTLAFINIKTGHVRSVVETFITDTFKSSVSVDTFAVSARIAFSTVININAVVTSLIEFSSSGTFTLEASRCVLTFTASLTWVLLTFVEVHASGINTTSIRANSVEFVGAFGGTTFAFAFNFPAVIATLTAAHASCEFVCVLVFSAVVSTVTASNSGVDTVSVVSAKFESVGTDALERTVGVDALSFAAHVRLFALINIVAALAVFTAVTVWAETFV